MKIMSQSNFQKIIDFHVCFGHPYRTERQLYVFEKEPKLVSLRYDLINEEIDELNDAYQVDDVVEIVDALTDILYVVYGMAAAFGINADENFYQYINDKIVMINEMDQADLSINHSQSNYQLVNTIYVYSHNDVTGAAATTYDIKKYLENIKVTEYHGILAYYLAQINYFNTQLKIGVQQNLFNSIEDNINELLYHTYLMGIMCGIDLDASYTIVHDSNMSKICHSEEEAQQTVQWYTSNDHRYDSPTYQKNNYGYVVFNESTGKTLKNINYTPANFDSLIL